MKKSGVAVKIINHFLTLFIVIALLTAVFVMFFRISGADLNLGGIHLFKIVSGSMEPTYQVGDYVVSFQKSADRLEPGDSIAFVSEEGETKGEVIVHRIVSFVSDGRITMRGDANPINDYCTVSADKIIGKVVARLPFLRYVDQLFSGIGSFIALIVLPLIIMITNEMIHLVRTAEHQKKITRMIAGYGLDPKDGKLYEIAEKYGEEAVRSIAVSGSARKTEREPSGKEK